VILTTHEVVGANTYGDEAELSDFGQQLWDGLISGSDQVFLTLNGHFWPRARTVRRNAAGHDTHLHITNYQDRYYGGAAMIRLYRFDLARNTIGVETISPWILGQAADSFNELQRQEIELTGPQDRFSLDIDFPQRFSGFAPVAPRPARPASRMLIPGTVAYWRFDGSRSTDRVSDLSGRGNDLTKIALPRRRRHRPGLVRRPDPPRPRPRPTDRRPRAVADAAGRGRRGQWRMVAVVGGWPPVDHAWRRGTVR
jgi:hypothetical protein